MTYLNGTVVNSTSKVTFKGIQPRTVLGITEAVGTIAFVLGVMSIPGGTYASSMAFFYAVALFGSGLTTLLLVILVRTVIRIADTNDRIVLELENL